MQWNLEKETLSTGEDAAVGGSAHILVVDDDDGLRDLLARYLRENGYRVSTAASAAEALATLGGLAFDLIVLDVMMPGESGVALTRRLRRSNAVPILLLTAMAEPEDRIAGLESGADDYLTKPFEPRELLLRIATILRRSRTPPPDTVRFGEVSYHPARGELRRGGALMRLTEGEGALLRAFTANPGVTLSREALREKIGAGVSLRAIDVQVTRLRRKIEPDPRAPRYLRTVWGRGYVLRTD